VSCLAGYRPGDVVGHDQVMQILGRLRAEHRTVIPALCYPPVWSGMRNQVRPRPVPAKVA